MDAEPINSIQEEQAKENEDSEPLQLLITYRRNDMTVQERLAMAKIVTEFGPSQRWDFVMPGAKQVIRRPYKDCNALINSNGLQRSIAAHF